MMLLLKLLNMIVITEYLRMMWLTYALGIMVTESPYFTLHHFPFKVEFPLHCASVFILVISSNSFCPRSYGFQVEFM